METATENELIEITLDNWLFNAGVIGLIRILDTNIKYESNKLIIKRNDLNSFSKKFFEKAFEQYGRYNRIFNRLKETHNFLIKYSATKEFTEEEKDKIKQKIDSIKNQLVFTLIKDKIKEKNISFPKIEKDYSNLSDSIDFLKIIIKIFEDDKEEFFNNDVKIYLGKIYGQKSFLNKSIKTNFLEKFKSDFEIPILEIKNILDKKLCCINCGKRNAKKDTNFDTGISPFSGLNKDSVNYCWNFNTKLPLCEICELVYFCSFAGFTDVSKGKEKTFYFVNKNDSVESLLNTNNQLFQLLKDENIKENLLVRFFSDLILNEKKYTSDFILKNLNLIELDLTNDTFPKIHSLNISKEEAEFFKDFSDTLKIFTNKGYTLKDTNKNILTDIVELFLKKSLNFNYLNKLLKYYISSKYSQSSFYKVWYNTYHLQILNTIISKYLKKRRVNMSNQDIEIGTNTNKIKNSIETSQNELWVLYNQGKELRNKLQDNKVSTISYKLLNALKTENSPLFMDVIFRTYMGLKLGVPSNFVKAINNKGNFNSMGYSFLNGLLGEAENPKKQKSTNSNNSENINKGE